MLATAVPSPPALQVDLHAHPRGVVSFDAINEHRIRIQSGHASGRCEGKRFTASSGDIDLLPAGTAARWEEDDASASIVLRIPPSLLQRAAEDFGFDGARIGLAPRHQLRDPQIEHLAWALRADREAGRPSGPLYAESLGLALAAHLVTQHRAAPSIPSRGLSKPQLQRISDFVEAHLDETLTLSRLAEVAGISASHLKTLFKRSTGLPVHAYVVRRRVERARALLLQRELPAGRIALEAGFSHHSHMVRCLRRVLGAAAAPLLRGGR